MNIASRNIIRKTQSVCPTCLVKIPAIIYEKADSEVYMHKECSEHGVFDVYIWHDAERYKMLLCVGERGRGGWLQQRITLDDRCRIG